MKCCKCGSTNSSIYHRTAPKGVVNVDWECDECKHGLPPLPKLAPICKGDTYKERCEYQLQEWVKGNSIHNTTDNECCPDFSCCYKENLQPEEVRKTFFAANKETREGMLCAFLGSAIAKYTEKKVFIADGKTEIIKDLN